MRTIGPPRPLGDGKVVVTGRRRCIEIPIDVEHVFARVESPVLQRSGRAWNGDTLRDVRRGRAWCRGGRRYRGSGMLQA